MNDSTERRERYRRFEDRRVALLLALHEVLFEEPPGPARDALLLGKLKDDFRVNRAELLLLDGRAEGPRPRLGAAVCDDDAAERARAFDGEGTAALIELHRQNSGALTLTKFRRPSAFSDAAWAHLWEAELGDPFTALLSVELSVSRAPRSFIWLLLENASREWGSHDRELAEEVARLLGRAADRALG
jgi:hypothetical protein